MAHWTKILTTAGAACMFAGAAFAQQTVPVPDDPPSVFSDEKEPAIPPPDKQTDPAPDPVITYNRDTKDDHHSKADRDERSRLGINSQTGGPMQPIADSQPDRSDARDLRAANDR